MEGDEEGRGRTEEKSGQRFSKPKGIMYQNLYNKGQDPGEKNEAFVLGAKFKGVP